MADLQLANLDEEYVDLSSAKYQLSEREDVFIGLFNLICLNESFFKITTYYSIIKWLDCNLSIQLSNLNALKCMGINTSEDKEKYEDIFRNLMILKSGFIIKIQEINFDNIEDSVTFVYYQKIQDYFKNITPKDLDFKHHDETKFLPSINSSGYLSGLQKDWIDRIHTIEQLYENAEINFEKKKRKKSYSWSSFLSLGSGSSKKVIPIQGVEKPAIESCPSSNPEQQFNQLKEQEPILDNDLDQSTETNTGIFFWNNQLSRIFGYVSSPTMVKHFLSGAIISGIFITIYNIHKKINYELIFYY